MFCLNLHNAQKLTIFEVLKMFQTSDCSMTGFHTNCLFVTFFNIDQYFLSVQMHASIHIPITFCSKIVVYLNDSNVQLTKYSPLQFDIFNPCDL